MLRAITRALTTAKANNNPLILQNDISAGYVGELKLRFVEIGPHIMQAISEAEEEVLLIGYKLEGGSDGDIDLINAFVKLNQKAKDKNKTIRVRMLVNHVGGFAGLLINENSSKLRQMQFSNLDFQYAEHSHFGLGSYHQKQVNIDGHTVILMSGDFYKANNYKNNFHGWIELASTFYGTEIATHVRNGFMAAWNSKQTRVINDKKQPLPIFESERKHATPNDDPVPLIYLHKKANGHMFKREYLSPHAIAVTTAIENAKHSINIMMPNINEPAILHALANAYARGLKINIVIGKYHNDLAESLPYMGGTNQQALQTLLTLLEKKGIRDFSKLNLRYSTNDKGEIEKHHGQQTLHAKLIIIDDVSIVGSSVLDKQSTLHSQEGDICIQSDNVAKKYLHQIFYPIFNLGKNAFLHSDYQMVKTPWQKSANKLDKLLMETIKTLLTKRIYHSCSETDSNLIQAILGEPNQPHTLFHLQKIISDCKAKANCISTQDLYDIKQEFEFIIKDKIVQNKEIQTQAANVGFFHRIATHLLNVLKHIFSTSWYLKKINTPDLCLNIGNATLSKLSLFNVKNNSNKPDADAVYKPIGYRS